MLQAWSKQHNSFLRPLKKKGFKEERVTTIGWYAIDKSTTLESNKSHIGMFSFRASRCFEAGVEPHEDFVRSLFE